MAAAIVSPGLPDAARGLTPRGLAHEISAYHRLSALLTTARRGTAFLRQSSHALRAPRVQQLQQLIALAEYGKRWHVPMVRPAGDEPEANEALRNRTGHRSARRSWLTSISVMAPHQQELTFLGVGGEVPADANVGSD